MCNKDLCVSLSLVIFHKYYPQLNKIYAMPTLNKEYKLPVKQDDFQFWKRRKKNGDISSKNIIHKSFKGTKMTALNISPLRTFNNNSNPACM